MENDRRKSRSCGEPPNKKLCPQPSGKPSKFFIPFNGTTKPKENTRPPKRTAPQDNLSAQVYMVHPYKLY
ncbi:hypothetical protein CRE_00760 [Caenorhabditis remanei]|uniref:Uncharacterized protein n=1 Tax=Caenorhabditis remanei TaxID=31234 RepID=E3LE63_CAERE|nr:hypothetical protein CRE_00760 [Caenorhabditis remanei]